jgi:hypothetical protein
MSNNYEYISMLVSLVLYKIHFYQILSDIWYKLCSWYTHFEIHDINQLQNNNHLIQCHICDFQI